MQETLIQYRVLAEMVDAPGIPPGTMKWLGDHRQPRWTDEAEAIAFATKPAICQFYHNGNGYPDGLYRPKPGTAMVIERIVQTTTTLRASRLTSTAYCADA